jgi:hypothetical protein
MGDMVVDRKRRDWRRVCTDFDACKRYTDPNIPVKRQFVLFEQAPVCHATRISMDPVPRNYFYQQTLLLAWLEPIFYALGPILSTSKISYVEQGSLSVNDTSLSYS